MSRSPSSAATLRQFRTLFEAGTVAALTDGQLLERFLEGSGEGRELAFAALVTRHGPMVLGVCRRALANPDDAADAFQATFLILVKKARSVRVDDSLGRWLYGVCRKVAARARVVASKRPKGEAGALDAMAAQSTDPDRFERLAILDEELGRLPEGFRSAIVLCDLEGLTHEEAARDLLCPVGTIKSRLTRGRQKLRERLERRGLTPSALAFPPIVPAALIETTARLAWTMARCSQAAGVVPAASVVLAQEVFQAMTGFKLKLAAAAVLSLGVAATGAGVIAQGQEGRDDPSKPSAYQPLSVEVIGHRIKLDGKAASLDDLSKRLSLMNDSAAVKIRAASDQKYTDVARVVEAVQKAGPFAIQVESPESNGMLAKLEQPMSLAVQQRPLFEVVNQIRNQTGLNIILDMPSLRDLGLTELAPVSITAKDLPLRNVLKFMLRSLDLTYQVDDNYLLITSVHGPSLSNLQAELEGHQRWLARTERIAKDPQDPKIATARAKVSHLEALIEETKKSMALTHMDSPKAFRPRRVEELVRVNPLGRGPAVETPREFRKVSLPDYVVEPPDIITVDVHQALPGRPIGGERLVLPDGKINLGYYGEVYVAGLTTVEIKEKVALHLLKYLDEETLGLARVDLTTGQKVPPSLSNRISVAVSSFNSKVYYVQGEVGTPGRLPITGNETVLDAINYANGLGPNASKTQINVVRPTPAGATEVVTLPVDLDAIVNQGDSKTNYQLFPGDRVIVGRDPRIEPAATPAVRHESATPPDVEARLQAVERKLDEVLKALQPTPKP